MNFWRIIIVSNLWSYLVLFFGQAGISDVAEVYQEAMKVATSDSHAVVSDNHIQAKITGFSEDLQKDLSIALSKIQDGLQYLSYLILSTSMPAA